MTLVHHMDLKKGVSSAGGNNGRSMEHLKQIMKIKFCQMNGRNGHTVSKLVNFYDIVIDPLLILSQSWK